MSSLIRLANVDVLADILDGARVRGRVYCRGEFSAPWSIVFSAEVSHFHVVEKGTCWIRFDDLEPRRVDANDVIVIPRGRRYQLSDDPVTPPVALSDLVENDVGGPHIVLKHGGGGTEVDLICGAFDFRRPYGTTLLGSLPEWLHVRASETSEWVESAIRLLSAETRRADEGTGAIIGRLTEIMLVHALRAWLRSRPQAATGWLGALREPAIGRALQLIHQMPERPWTVASLAAEVGMSRSPFASRFTALVGTSPLAYLARWRMHVAADLLETTAMSMAQIAERVGYASEAAFSRGFKKEFGASPGAFRRMRV